MILSLLEPLDGTGKTPTTRVNKVSKPVRTIHRLHDRTVK